VTAVDALRSMVASPSIRKTPLELCCIKLAASPNVSLFVEFNVSPVPSVCVSVVSESAPNFNTAESEPSIRSSGSVTSALLSSNTALLAGCVQNTSFVPALKVTALLLFELDKTVVLESVSVDASVTVPIPISNSAAVL